jgi:hypothetical protein
MPFLVVYLDAGAGLDLLVAPESPRWAYPITHEHWSRFNIAEQCVIGKILNNMHYWRSVLLPGDAAEAAGLTCRTNDADLDNESEPDTE